MSNIMRIRTDACNCFICQMGPKVFRRDCQSKYISRRFSDLATVSDGMFFKKRCRSCTRSSKKSDKAVPSFRKPEFAVRQEFKKKRRLMDSGCAHVAVDCVWRVARRKQRLAAFVAVGHVGVYSLKPPGRVCRCGPRVSWKTRQEVYSKMCSEGSGGVGSWFLLSTLKCVDPLQIFRVDRFIAKCVQFFVFRVGCNRV